MPPSPLAPTTDRCSVVPSPVGDLVLTGDGTAITGCLFDGPGLEFVDALERDDGAFVDAAAQLREYFAGDRTAFDLPLRPHGTDFQLRVWVQLRTIPYGTTASYGEVAAALGTPTGARAVGLANGRNPISIIVPCHRVIGANGSLTGYGGGTDRKRTLLDLERGAATLL